MAVEDTLIGGALAIVGGGLVTWLDAKARRRERAEQRRQERRAAIAAERDRRDDEVAEAIAETLLTLRAVAPAHILKMTEDVVGTFDREGRERVEHARSLLARVIVRHPDKVVRDGAEDLVMKVTTAGNLSRSLAIDLLRRQDASLGADAREAYDAASAQVEHMITLVTDRVRTRLEHVETADEEESNSPDGG